MPLPVRLTTEEDPVEELLARVSDPLTVPDAVGANWTDNVAVWFGFSVSGKVAPEVEKPDPETVAELMVTAAVPVEDSLID
jgi:hypothetical protein